MSTPTEGYNSRTAEKFVARMPPGMRTRIQQAAIDHHRSMNDEVIHLLERGLSQSNEFDQMLADIRYGRDVAARFTEMNQSFQLLSAESQSIDQDVKP